ncbi:MAG: DoxX family protein [Gemmatimonadaceae bacterium]
MSLFSGSSPRQINLALLILRVVAGMTLAAHGYQKVFGYGLSGVAGSFGTMGVPMANIVGPSVAILELVGGVAIVVGLLTRLFSIALAVDMLGAIFFVHMANGFFAPKGIELTLLLAAMFVTLLITGAGTLSVDSALDKNLKESHA